MGDPGPTPPGPAHDDDVPAFLADLGVPGIVDVHVHFMPERVQRKVWAAFDRLSPPWPMAYRLPEEERLRILRRIGVVAHPALAYAHRPGMAAWLNTYTLDLADRAEQVVPAFTFYPDDDVDDYVAHALGRGAVCAKVHLQVGKFAANDPRLDDVWSELERRRLAVVLHAGAVADGSGGEEWCGPERVVRLLERFPHLRLVIAHAGAPDYEDFLRLAETHGSVLFDTAMVFIEPPYIGRYPEELIDRLVALDGRIVFGSDFPSVPQEYAAQLRRIAGLGVDRAWLRRLLWETPRRVLGLDTPVAGSQSRRSSAGG